MRIIPNHKYLFKCKLAPTVYVINDIKKIGQTGKKQNLRFLIS